MRTWLSPSDVLHPWRQRRPLNLNGPVSGLREGHGYAHNSANDFRLPRVRKTADFAFRKRMRDCRQVAIAQFAPTAQKFSPELQKINRPVMLVFPVRWNDLALVLVDLDDGPRSNNRKHASIGAADQTIYAVAKVQMLQKANRHFSPNFYELQ